MPFPRVDEITVLVDAILDGGARGEILALLGLLAGRAVVAQERAHELREAPHEPRTLTVEQATHLYPVSRSFVYEHGEQMGFARRVPGARKLVVDEAALQRVLLGERR